MYSPVACAEFHISAIMVWGAPAYGISCHCLDVVYKLHYKQASIKIKTMGEIKYIDSIHVMQFLFSFPLHIINIL